LAGLAPLFAFFGGHTFPAVAHFAAEARAIAAVATHTARRTICAKVLSVAAVVRAEGIGACFFFFRLPIE